MTEELTGNGDLNDIRLIDTRRNAISICESAPGLPEFMASVGKTQADDYAAQDASLNIFGDNQLSDLERRFLTAAESGNYKLVRKILEENSSLNVNCVDVLGRTALQLAVTQEHIDVIKFLLVRCKNEIIEDAFLHAIKNGYVKICELFLNHPIYKNAQQKMQMEQSSYYDNEENNSDFSPDITPILLASHCNNFDIVFMLIERGFFVHKPHPYFCECTECENHKKFDRVVHSRSRLNAYRGLASTAYMSLSSDDPIMTAFELSQLLAHLSEKENEYKSEYKDLSDKCKDYAVNLLDLCRTEAEVNAALHGDGNIRDLSRIRLAIQYEQRRFIAHASAQERMMTLWYADAQWIRNKPMPFIIFLVPMMAITMPILAAIYFIAPHSKPGQFLRIPVVKFVHHSISYIVFLALLFVVTSEEKDLNYMIYDSGNTWVYATISLFIFGMFWNECKQLWDEGAYAYLHDAWNMMDIVMLALYTASISCWLVEVMAKAEYKRKTLENPDPGWEFKEGIIPPHIMGNILFSVANVLSFARVAYILPASETFGQLQISYGRMLRDVFKFLFIYLTMLIAFMCGLTSLYSIYSPLPSAASKPEPGLQNYIEATFTSVHQERDSLYFDSLLGSFLTLFMSTFGLGNSKAPRLTNEQHNNTATDMMTEIVGYTLYGIYIMFAVVVLINMLIAMMSNTFEQIRADEDVEWKYARAKLWLSYFEDGGTLPVPFNIIPTPKSVKYFVYRIAKLFGSECGRNNEISSDWGDDGDVPGSKSVAYKTIMRRVVMRYVHSIKHGKQKSQKTDFNEVKEELSKEMEAFHLKMDKKLSAVNSTMQFMAGELITLEKRVMTALNISLPEQEEIIEDTLDARNEIDDEFMLELRTDKNCPWTPMWNRGKFIKNPNKYYRDLNFHISNSLSVCGSAEGSNEEQNNSQKDSESDETRKQSNNPFLNDDAVTVPTTPVPNGDVTPLPEGPDVVHNLAPPSGQLRHYSPLPDLQESIVSARSSFRDNFTPLPSSAGPADYPDLFSSAFPSDHVIVSDDVIIDTGNDNDLL